MERYMYQKVLLEVDDDEEQSISSRETTPKPLSYSLTPASALWGR